MSPTLPVAEIDDPDFVWFNVAEPLSLEKLRGRLVILDFWTSCCINCIHVLESLKHLEARFGEAVVVIGVHTPKFAAEESSRVVASAIARYAIRHPVIQDVGMRLWQKYGIQSWPTLVLISPSGKVLGEVVGEPDLGALETFVEQTLGKARRKGQMQDEVTPLPRLLPEQPTGRFFYPGRIKAIPGENPGRRWVVVDSGHHQIVTLAEDGREVERFGDGLPGFVDGSPATCRFFNPQGVIAAADTLYVADTFNHAIRRIDLGTGLVTTLVGDGKRGFPLNAGGVAAEGARLASVWDLEFLEDRLLFANAGTHQIGMLHLTTGEVSLLAGTGGEDLADGPALSAMLAQPSGLALDPSRKILYFVDSETSAVRTLTLTGERRVSTLVGKSLFDSGHIDGPLPQASLQHPRGLACAGDRLWVADSFNHTLRIVDLPAGRIGDIETLGCLCSESPCLPLLEPSGVVVATPTRLLVCDTGNHRIREYLLDARVCRTIAA
ncbi:MAG: redoxin domain-containing protein [Magnetococcales bacterium]|nr:redoxin domain-containing protein [Magnetococcales bacterium]